MTPCGKNSISTELYLKRWEIFVKICLVTCIPINWCMDVVKLPEVSKGLLYMTVFTIFLQTGSPTFINIYENCPEENRTVGMYLVFLLMHM